MANILKSGPIVAGVDGINGATGGTAALFAEQRKHQVNDPKCDTLGWKCILLAVESYGNWGLEARQAFSHLASRLSFGIGHQKSKLLVDIYGRLNVTLNLTCYHLGRWMMLVEKDHDGLLIIVVVQTLMSLVLQLVQCFRLIDPFVEQLSEIELDLLLRMFYVLKVSMHVVLVLMLALCHDCH
ncbi:hypothetical protein EMCRGX_G007638 [Ephydatia muelleri]